MFVNLLGDLKFSKKLYLPQATLALHILHKKSFMLPQDQDSGKTEGPLHQQPSQAERI